MGIQTFFAKKESPFSYLDRSRSQFSFLRLDKGDGFTALAAGIVDGFLKHPHWPQNLALIKLLSEAHETYFARSAIDQNLSFVEQIKLIHRNRKEFAYFLRTLAYTLRQVAMHHIKDNPLQFCLAFQANPTHLPFSMAALNDSAIAALSSKLRIHITVYTTGENKSLYARTTFGEKGDFVVILHALNDIYEAAVDKSIFNGIDPILSTLEPVKAMPSLSTQDCEKLKHDFEVSRKALIQKYQSNWERLYTAWSAKELTLEDLKDLYIAQLNEPQASAFNHYFQHGIQTFFQALDLEKEGTMAHPIENPEVFNCFTLCVRKMFDDNYAKRFFECIENKDYGRLSP